MTWLGTDRVPFSTTHVVGDLADREFVRRLLEGAHAIIHVAALHAPHVGILPNDEFRRVNFEGTRVLAEEAVYTGVRRLVFTSTTALYGNAVVPGSCTWVDETTRPKPATIYHQTKLDAERLLESFACPELIVRVLRMSRCFPEAANVMAVHRLHRGVDVRDVAEAHVAALTNGGPDFQRYVISGHSPFRREDCNALAIDATEVIRRRLPALARAFAHREWQLPKRLDRVYAAAVAESDLGWKSAFGFREVLHQLDRRSLEVLPPFASSKEYNE